jgi:hypothetical protein
MSTMVYGGGPRANGRDRGHPPREASRIVPNGKVKAQEVERSLCSEWWAVLGSRVPPKSLNRKRISYADVRSTPTATPAQMQLFSDRACRSA